MTGRAGPSVINALICSCLREESPSCQAKAIETAVAIVIRFGGNEVPLLVILQPAIGARGHEGRIELHFAQHRCS